jgi:hypothetical protein
LILKLVVESICALLLFIIGGIAVLRPDLIQHYALAMPRRLNPWSDYILSAAYRRHTRLIGGLALAMSALICVALYRSWLSY